MKMLSNFILRHRRIAVVLIHAAIVVVANYLAFVLRFNGEIPKQEMANFLHGLPWALAITLTVFFLFRLHEGLWRYVGIWDLGKIVQGAFVSTAVFAFVMRDVLGIEGYALSIYLLYAILLISIGGGARMARRLYRELGQLEHGRRVVIIGAGDAGEMIVRDMKYNPFYGYEPVGFIDDDPQKVGQRVHGIPVLGTTASMAEIIARQLPQEVIIAMPRVESAAIRRIVQALESFNVQIRTLPSLRDLLDGTVSVSQIRDLELADLLDRPVVQLDRAPVLSLLRNKRVLVTGAGGSIGSELCRQIASCEPELLLACDRYENTLFELGQELREGLGNRLVQVIADVTDNLRVRAVLRQWNPQIIFHAAAYKHVPMMQANPCEAVKNNVTGTRILAQAAAERPIERFILISTDKAVNPTSVMGATKRIAELIANAIAHESGRCFVTVRFGNVLGSNGSVVPEFVKQVKAGGPLTITHPEMRRYFMLIPEAVQLVLQAAAAGESGTTYVLEMGRQLRILDVARTIVRLSGHMPDQFPIKFIGLRPGEKLYEELVSADEVAEPSSVESIVRITTQTRDDPRTLMNKVLKLEREALSGDDRGVIRRLTQLVPTSKLIAAGGEPAPGSDNLADDLLVAGASK